MLAAVIESKEVEDPGTGTTTVRIDPNDRQPDDPGTRTMSVEIDPTACQDQDDPGTGMTSVKTDPRDCQAPGDPGIRTTTRKVGLIDYLDSGDPETLTRAEMIEQGGLDNHVNRPPTDLHLFIINYSSMADKIWTRIGCFPR